MSFYKVLDLKEGLVEELVADFKATRQPKLKELKKYYLGETKISQREVKPNKPSNKVVNPFANYITDTITGYFLGNPITYSSANEVHMIKIQSILDKNLEQGHNINLAKDLSIYGVAFELLYLDEKLDVKMVKLNPEETFMILDASLDKSPLAAVRFYSVKDYVDGTVSEFYEVYTKNEIILFKDGEVVDVKEHLFGKVPVVFYENTVDQQGDFQQVISLIDAYDAAVSDTLDNLDYFADSYLAIYDSEVQPEDLEHMSSNRVMLLNGGSKAEFLIKGSETVQAEEFKQRVKDDIFHLSSVPNMNSENLGSGVSGEAMKYRLLALDNKITAKERLFAKSLEHRLKLLTLVLNLKGGSYDFSDIQFSFHKNLPVNMNYVVDVVQKLQGVVSHQTLLQQLPFIDDVKKELDLIEQEEDLNIQSFMSLDD